jgi:hypothetical protein
MLLIIFSSLTGKTLCSNQEKAGERFGDNSKNPISVDKSLFHTQLNNAVLSVYQQWLTVVVIALAF